MLTFLLTGYFFVETYNAELTTSLTRSDFIGKHWIGLIIANFLRAKWDIGKLHTLECKVL